jgi:hypothetical protein
MVLNYFTLLLWLNVAAGAVGLLGAYPTWLWWGRKGLACEVAAGMIVGSVMLFNAMMLIGSALSGPARLAFAFCLGSVLRVAAALGIAWIASEAIPLPWTPLAVWVGVFYVTMLHCEAFWLAGEFKRDAHLVALGRLPRDRRWTLMTPGRPGDHP